MYFKVNVVVKFIIVCRPLETLDVEGLVRLWAHEALRLFHDRLVTDEERKWTNDNVDAIALKVKERLRNAITIFNRKCCLGLMLTRLLHLACTIVFYYYILCSGVQQCNLGVCSTALPQH